MKKRFLAAALLFGSLPALGQESSPQSAQLDYSTLHSNHQVVSLKEYSDFNPVRYINSMDTDKINANAADPGPKANAPVIYVPKQKKNESPWYVRYIVRPSVIMTAAMLSANAQDNLDRKNQRLNYFNWIDDTYRNTYFTSCGDSCSEQNFFRSLPAQRPYVSNNYRNFAVAGAALSGLTIFLDKLGMKNLAHDVTTISTTFFVTSKFYSDGKSDELTPEIKKAEAALSQSQE